MALIDEYKKRRDRAGVRSADGQLALSKWCDEHALKDQAEAHALGALKLDAGTEDAWNRLGFRKRGGAWVNDQALKANAEELAKQRKADRSWQTLLSQYKARLKDSTTRVEAARNLANISDPRALPAVWRIFGKGTPDDQALGAQIVARINSPAATRTLGVIALSSKSAEARRIALNALYSRDPRDFVGLWIGLLHGPAKNDGVFRFSFAPMSLSFENSSGSFEIESPHFRFHAQRRLSSLTGMTRSTEPATELRSYFFRPNLFDALLDAEAEHEDLFQNCLDVALFDYLATISSEAEASRDDERTLTLLQDVTGMDLGSDPKDWMSWWNDQRGIVYDETTSDAGPLSDYSKNNVDLQDAIHVATSCFNSGTLVRTIDGAEPIQKIKVGDLVLTQNVTSGAIEAEAVTSVFHNPPREMFKITFFDDTITATGIHRFWKPGVGWVMTRDLKEGDVVRSLWGASRVRSLEPAGKQPAFNLAVARNRSYFVGAASKLVHDFSVVETVAEPFDSATIPSAKPQ